MKEVYCAAGCSLADGCPAPAFERWLHPDNFDGEGLQRERLSDLTSPIVYDRWPVVRVTTDL